MVGVFVERRFTKKGSLTTGQSSGAIIIPPNLSKVSIAVFPGASAVISVELSVSSVEDLDSAGNFVDWETGDVTEDTLKVLEGPVNAVKITTASGPADYELLG